LSSMSAFADHFLAGILICCAVAAAIGVLALRMKPPGAVRMLVAAKLIMFAGGALSVAVLNFFIAAFITDDFTIEAVAKYSSSNLPFLYKVGAVWAGPPGSLLLWALGAVVLFGLWLVTLKTDGSIFNATAMIVGGAVCFGFLLLVILIARPFAAAAARISDGAGLNPLLQNFWMVVHPPALFLAYAAFLIPFVVVVASVFGGGTQAGEFYLQLRRWLLVGVGLLCLGIVSGARWAYLELDWGGYWAWDPVQNLSLLPLLAAVAALHSINAIQLGDRFRRWTLALAPVPFVLCLFLAYVASSGILKSVHAFGRSEVSSGLLSFAIACLLLWLACLLKAVRISVAPDRESIFHLDKSKILFWSNIGFVVTAAAVGLATFSTLILQTITHSTTVRVPAEPFYRIVISAAGILLVFLVGFYRLADLRQRRGGSLTPVLACCAPAVILWGVLYRVVGLSLLLSVACSLGVFSAVAILIKLFVAVKLRDKIGGCVAHMGVVLVLVAAGLSATEQGVQTKLAEGKKLPLGGWEFTYDSFDTRTSHGVTMAGPRIALSKDGRNAVLWPHRKTRPANPEIDAESEAAIKTGWFEDVHLSYDGPGEDGTVIITARIRPFMFWLWLGAGLIVTGSALAAFEGKTRLGPAGEAEAAFSTKTAESA